jgi:hypothetical protein
LRAIAISQAASEPRQRVDLALMPLAGQCGDGDGCDVTSVDHRDPSVPSGGVDRPIADHRKHVLHEEHRANNREGEARLLKRLLRLPVLTRNLEWRALIGAEY